MNNVELGKASIVLHSAWHHISPKSDQKQEFSHEMRIIHHLPMEKRFVVVGNRNPHIICEKQDIKSEYDNACC